MNIETIIQAIDSYNRILCSLLTNETVEVIALISSGRVFHRILPLYFIEPKELAEIHMEAIFNTCIVRVKHIIFSKVI